MSDPLPYIEAAFRGRGRSRSPLYLWLSQHYDQLAAARLPGTRVDWVSVAAEMKALGFKTAGKRSLKPETVRRTWYRVEADRKRGILPPPPDRPASSSPPAVPRTTVQPPGQVPSDDGTAADADDSRPRYTFKPGKIR